MKQARHEKISRARERRQPLTLNLRTCGDPRQREGVYGAREHLHFEWDSFYQLKGYYQQVWGLEFSGPRFFERDQKFRNFGEISPKCW